MLIHLSTCPARRIVDHSLLTSHNFFRMQWLEETDVDLNDPANAGLRELRALLSADHTLNDPTGSVPTLRLGGRDDSHLRPPTHARRDRWRGLRARWHAISARAALGQRCAVQAPWQTDAQQLPGTANGAISTGQHLLLAASIRRARLHDHLSNLLAMQAQLARGPAGKCDSRSACSPRDWLASPPAFSEVAAVPKCLHHRGHGAAHGGSLSLTAPSIASSFAVASKYRTDNDKA
jgi:hypothetical protein